MGLVLPRHRPIFIEKPPETTCEYCGSKKDNATCKNCGHTKTGG